MMSESPVLLPLVSVCIPTYKRPNLLELALRSVLAQDYEAVEIIVGDDSPDANAERVIDDVRSTSQFSMRYHRNVPKLGQNANVNRLFQEAQGEYLVLLHDDDLLLPGAIRNLISPVLADANIQVVFGKQNLIDGRGMLLENASDQLNITFGRVGESGQIPDPLAACLLQQFPNDCFLVKTELARRTGYRSESDIGVYVDVDFGIRLGQALRPGEMWFANAFVGSYRFSDDAISTSPISRKIDHPVAAEALYDMVAAIDLPATSEYARDFILRSFGDAIVKGLAQRRRRKAALRVFLSPTYGWRRRGSIKGMYHFAMILVPEIDRFRRY
jgi:glycosyltransferase involved in cell wall biosynthesis